MKKTKCTTIREMIKQVYGGNRELAATQCGMKVNNVTQLISRGYDVAELKNGDWVMLTDKTKIFKGVDNGKLNSRENAANNRGVQEIGAT
jgi:hypothetical protein